MKIVALLCLSLWSVVWAQNSPVISLVANAEGEKPVIAPNTWIEIKGQNLSRANDTRIWQDTDFVNKQMPTALHRVSLTVNGNVDYVSSRDPAQLNVLTALEAMSGARSVRVRHNGFTSDPFSVSAQPIS